jgi:hypothetical protein
MIRTSFPTGNWRIGAWKFPFEENLFDDDLESATDECHGLTHFMEQIIENTSPLCPRRPWRSSLSAIRGAVVMR